MHYGKILFFNSLQGKIISLESKQSINLLQRHLWNKLNWFFSYFKINSEFLDNVLVSSSLKPYIVFNLSFGVASHFVREWKAKVLHHEEIRASFAKKSIEHVSSALFTRKHYPFVTRSKPFKWLTYDFSWTTT